MSVFSRLIDERFLAHRRRSTSTAGIASVLVAWSVFVYRFYVDRIWSWELFAVVVTFVVFKLALMTWYYLTD
jgi:hypothetical protein